MIDNTDVRVLRPPGPAISNNIDRRHGRGGDQEQPRQNKEENKTRIRTNNSSFQSGTRAQAESNRIIVELSVG